MMNSIFIVALLASACLADLYMHQFRGSNNRLNEKSANRQNGNRLCDTQNNNRGGYNVGELGATNGFGNNANAFATDSSNFKYDDTEWSRGGNDGNKQFEEVFLEGSKQSITWTAQHGCGNNKNNCNMVVEYTCDSHDASQQDNGNNGILDQNFAHSTTNAALQRQDNSANANFLNNWASTDHSNYDIVTGLRVMLSNGANTNTPNDPNNVKNSVGTFKNNNDDNEGRHEPEEAYAFAKQRLRNKNLFTADQKLQGDDTTKTRQNPGGTRRGLETPEERDYFPYWLPSIWRPVAMAHNSLQECETQMRAKSSAIETKTACVPYKNQLAGGNEATAQQLQNILRATSKTECETTVNNGAAGQQGKWIEQKYDMPPGYPQCVQNTWSQVNNLGNVADTPEGGLPQNWDWTIPTLDQLKNSGCYVYETAQSDQGAAGAKQRYVRMVMRMRYNMTTMDYSPYETDANCNQGKKRQSPVQQNPTVDVGVEMQGLRLAINTAQTGRTFQDRSHAFRVMAKPIAAANNQPVASLANKNIINVSVQGKRGNIVQTFPAVEYDFWPKIVNMNVGDCLAFQWTGSNTHNNGNPGGDGQTGDAGEGRGGSDRSNLMQIMDKNSTFPAPLDKMDQLPITDFFKTSDVFQTYTGKQVNSGQTVNGAATSMDAQLYFMSGGFYQKESDVNSASSNIGNNANDAQLNVLLNNSPSSMRSMTVCPKVAGTYDFTCTRNNNFSNRDQKLTINVNQATQG
jgi:plastocyanin